MKKVEYALIVKSKTRLESLIERFNTRLQARFYIENSGGDFNEYELEHEIFQCSLNDLQSNLTQKVRHKIIRREYLPSFLFSDGHLIIVIGQDGLVANTAKYSNGVPIIAVNPDKERYDGVLLPFDVSNFLNGVESVLSGDFQTRSTSFAEAKLNDGQRLLAFNDLFIGASSHISAKYKITFGEQTEEHSSSGIIVSTEAGSTGWMSSVFNMVNGVLSMTRSNDDIDRPMISENELVFAVREPFKSIRTQCGITTGILKYEKELRVESLMPNSGVIFSDGIESDFLRFNSGTIASIGLSKEKANLVLNRDR